MKELTCFAHRGASGHAPENTLMAMEKAMDMGAPWIEIDVQLVEGRLVVIHDHSLDRTTDGRGLVSSCSFEELRRLDAGRGERVPLLEEALACTSGRCSLNIELKGPGTALPTLELLRRRVENGTLDWPDVLVSSFNHHWLRQIKEAEPACPLGANLCGLPLDYARFAEGLGASSVHFDMEFIDEALVADAHRRGLKVLVFTVNRREDLERVRLLGVDGVFTNYPELLIPQD